MHNRPNTQTLEPPCPFSLGICDCSLECASNGPFIAYCLSWTNQIKDYCLKKVLALWAAKTAHVDSTQSTEAFRSRRRSEFLHHTFFAAVASCYCWRAILVTLSLGWATNAKAHQELARRYTLQPQIKDMAWATVTDQNAGNDTSTCQPSPGSPSLVDLTHWSMYVPIRVYPEVWGLSHSA